MARLWSQEKRFIGEGFYGKMGYKIERFGLLCTRKEKV